MDALIRLYVDRFGQDKLPTTFGVPDDEMTRLLSKALEDGKPITPEQMKAAGYSQPEEILI